MAAGDDRRRFAVGIEPPGIEQDAVVEAHEVGHHRLHRRSAVGIGRGQTRPVEIGVETMNDADGVGDDLVADPKRRHHGPRVERGVPGLELLRRLHDVDGLARIGDALLGEGQPGHLAADRPGMIVEKEFRRAHG
jgi:hypothetical protein